MTTQPSDPIRADGGGRARWLGRLMALAAAMFVANAPAQAPAAPGNAPPPLAADELEKLVAPIALYPDDLVAIILPAATSPLQLVQADRFLEKRKADPKAPLDDKWDDAVKTLLNYPDVVKKMSADLDWTSELGEAVVADQGAVLEAVQSFRRKTQAAGNLKTDAKQTVVVEKEVIKIVPSNPEVIYVPQYNPSTVVVAGAPVAYGYYPAPYPSYYYPYAPGAAMAAGVIWGAAIGAAWSGGHYGASYSGGGNTINIDNSKNVNRGGSASQRPAGSGSTSQWKSNKQPGQVSSSTGRTQSARVGDTGSRGGAGSAGARPSTQQAGGGGRASAQPSSGAFGGANSSGRQAQMDSSRGASSRSSSTSSMGGASRGSSSMGGGGSRPSPSMSSGASRGGGGASRGGGGGGRGGGGRR